MFAQLKEKTVWTAIVRLGVFFFVFLGLEYLFDNLMAAVTDSTGVVRAQSYVLGVSAMGFLAYGMLPERIRNAGHRRYRVLLEGAAGVLCTVSIMIICLHKNYGVLLLSGCLLFFVLGMQSIWIWYCKSRQEKDLRCLRELLMRLASAYSF